MPKQYPVTPEISILGQIVKDQWTTLATAAKDRHHPWHTPTLANVGDGVAQVRTVVLRSADPASRVLTCHTDTRSPKITHLKEDPSFSWLFYDRDAKIQLRAYGHAWIHHDDALAERRWQDGAWRFEVNRNRLWGRGGAWIEVRGSVARTGFGYDAQ